MQYKAIGFDYGGVIESNPRQNMMEEAALIVGVSAEDLRKKYFEHNHRSNVGNLPWIEMWPGILADLGKSEKEQPLRDFFTRFVSENKVDERVVGLMKNFRMQGYKVGILSNYTSGLHERLRRQGIMVCTDTVICSGDVGYQKPQREIFEIFAKELGVTLPELVYIDDAPKSLETAPELGYAPILFRGYEELVKHLDGLGLRKT